MCSNLTVQLHFSHLTIRLLNIFSSNDDRLMNIEREEICWLEHIGHSSIACEISPLEQLEQSKDLHKKDLNWIVSR